MRPIDADALKARIKKYGGIFERCRVCINGDCATCVIEHMDEITPTIDAVPVVRCKDCKFLGLEIIRGQHNCRMGNIPYCVSDDFCSFGEQSEEYAEKD